jgi:hypothetical protein
MYDEPLYLEHNEKLNEKEIQILKKLEKESIRKNIEHKQMLEKIAQNQK